MKKVNLFATVKGMKCPLCEGEFDPIELRTVGGRNLSAKQCVQCGGFWLPEEITEPLEKSGVSQYDIAQPNFSVKTYDLTCPLDGTLLEQAEGDAVPNGGKHWRCRDCSGQFYPKGQLALMTDHHHVQAGPAIQGHQQTRARAAAGVALVAVLMVASLSTLNRFNLEFTAADGSPLPTSGPNVITLVLLAVAYLSGTVLAVLSRRLPVIIMGWSVIAVCMFGFAIVIFGP